MTQQIYTKKDEVPVFGVMQSKDGRQFLAIEMPGDENIVKDECEYCAFLKKSYAWCGSMKCAASERSDSKTIVFIKYRPRANQENYI